MMTLMTVMTEMTGHRKTCIAVFWSGLERCPSVQSGPEKRKV